MPRTRTKSFHFPVSPGLRDDNTRYEVNHDIVTWRGYEIDADPQTFEALTGPRESAATQTRREYDHVAKRPSFARLGVLGA